MVAKLLGQTNNINKGLLTEWGLSARLCDICHTASALLYCRTDATFLCGACDTKIHATSHHDIIIARHERVWMCEVCEHAPAAVTCKADAAVLCAGCDHDIHSANPLARRHERVPIVPFFVSSITAARPTITTANSAFLIPNDLGTVAGVSAASRTPIEFDDNNDDDDADAWLIPNPNSTFLYSESYLVECIGQNLEKPSQKHNQQQSYDSPSFAFTDNVVPTQSQGNLSFSNTTANNHFFDTSFDIDFSQPAKRDNNKKNNPNNNSSFNFSTQHSVSSSEIGVVPEANTNSMSEVSYIFGNSVTSTSATGDGGSTIAGGTPMPALDREARVMRYREKRKNRKFKKIIRYASRKAYAETRPRIKGRFAKRTGSFETSDVNQFLGSDNVSATSFMFDQEYGVVPTF